MEEEMLREKLSPKFVEDVSVILAEVLAEGRFGGKPRTAGLVIRSETKL